MVIITNSDLITPINLNSQQVLNTKINVLLTIFSNDMRRSIPHYQQKFIRLAYDFQNLTGKTWCRYDFPHMKGGYFRQMMFQLSGVITKIVSGRPAFYKLNHTHIDESLTIEYRGVTPKTIDLDFQKLLSNLKQQPPQFHDIRAETRTDLYENLLNTSHKLNSHNKAFTITIPSDSRFAIKVNVYKTKMLVMVGCSQRPIPYSLEGFGELQFLLGKVVNYLTYFSGGGFIHEPIGDWMIKYYHFNRDGIIIDTPIHNYTITELQNHSVLYLKKFEDGTKRFRYEEHISSPKTINEIQQEFK